MQTGDTRETVDLTSFPDLVVVMLGFKLKRWRALPAFMGLGRGLAAVRRDRPDGLLNHEYLMFGWNHVGIHQYWRDPESLARFTRSMPHAGWWRDFTRDPRGCGFWHEAYHAGGGIEAIYVGMPDRPGLAGFASVLQPVGPLMSGPARLRADIAVRRPG